MMKYIDKPNLPQSKVSLVLAGELPGFLRDYLDSREIKIIHCDSNAYIDAAVKSHIDMASVHIGGNKIIVDVAQRRMISELKSEGFSVETTTEKISGAYPDDIKLNVALFGNNAVGAFKHIDSILLEHIESYMKFNVKQGYTKCSVLPVADNAVITDDKSIYNSLKNSVDTLLVRKGEIVLDGHDYGFIGGASVKISNNEILFFGDLEKHCDAEKIISFLNKYNHKAVYFKGYPLYDIGGMVTLCEI